MSCHTSMAMGGHCAVPQSALYEHGLLVGVVLRTGAGIPRPAAKHQHKEVTRTSSSGQATLPTTTPSAPEAPDRHPSVRGRGPATHLAAAATVDALTCCRSGAPASDRPNASPHSATESSANKPASGSPPDPAPMTIPDRQHPAGSAALQCFVGLFAVRGRRVARPGRWAVIAGDIQRGGPAEAGVTGRRD